MNPDQITDPSILRTQAIRRRSKASQVLLGICSGITADQTINDTEIHFLRQWLLENRDAAAIWPGKLIEERINTILADGIITDDERTGLIACLNSLVGCDMDPTLNPGARAIPFDDDPSIYFHNMTYCFTGEFYYGTRASCERAILKLGGTAVDNVSGKLDYLVVGSVIQPDWFNTSYGRKIETAIARQQRYEKPTIISERHWVAALEQA